MGVKRMDAYEGREPFKGVGRRRGGAVIMWECLGKLRLGKTSEFSFIRGAWPRERYLPDQSSYVKKNDNDDIDDVATCDTW